MNRWPDSEAFSPLHPLHIDNSTIDALFWLVTPCTETLYNLTLNVVTSSSSHNCSPSRRTLTALVVFALASRIMWQFIRRTGDDDSEVLRKSVRPRSINNTDSKHPPSSLNPTSTKTQNTAFIEPSEINNNCLQNNQKPPISNKPQNGLSVQNSQHSGPDRLPNSLTDSPISVCSSVCSNQTQFGLSLKERVSNLARNWSHSSTSPTLATPSKFFYTDILRNNTGLHGNLVAYLL